jgi:hypothetical protein
MKEVGRCDHCLAYLETTDGKCQCEGPVTVYNFGSFEPVPPDPVIGPALDFYADEPLSVPASDTWWGEGFVKVLRINLARFPKLFNR